MPTRRELLLTPAALLAARGESAPTPLPEYPPPRNLLVLRDGAGRERPIRTARDWARRRLHILGHMQRVMGRLPGPEDRVPLELRTEAEFPESDCLRRKVTYASAPGERVPAWLLLPPDRGPRPAVLALHQTVGIAKDEPVGLGGSPNLHYGRELVRRGYVVLAPDYPTMGEHRFDIYGRGWVSGSMKAVWDNIRAVDLLQGLSEVDDRRIGCLGHSLGGHNTLFTAAFEPRLRAVISNCGFTTFAKYYGGNLAGWTGERYMPRIRTDFPTPERMPFDFPDVLAAIAPRAVLASAPERDGNFEVGGVRDAIAAAAPLFRLLGRPDALRAVYPDCAHDWPAPDRVRAYDWLDAALPP
jgi:dienelactone hydrolase